MCSPSQHNKVAFFLSTLTDEETEAQRVYRALTSFHSHVSLSRNRVGVWTLSLLYLHPKPDVGLSEDQVDWLEAVGPNI